MAYTYNLSTTVRGGKRAIWDSVWDGSGAEDERRAGLTGTSTYHQCSMIFDTSALSGKTITGINLTFTVVSGTIPGHGTNNFPICYKADSSTTSWKRSSTSAVGYIKNQTPGGGSYGASNTQMTVNMGTTLPSYGYVAGSIKSPSGSYKSVILGSSATLAVTTNETQWSYTLAYDANGGSGAPASETKTNIQVNPSCSFTVSSTKPTKSNTSPGNFTVTYNAGGGSVSTSSANTTATRTTSYTFSSWNTNAAGTGTNYAPGSTYTFTSGNVGDILYAKYSESTTVSSVTLPTPTKTGYSFNGWYTASTGGTKAGNAGAAYLPFNNITLYAQWTPLKYRIDYNGNAGTGVSGVPEYQEQTHGVELTLRSGTPTRTSTNATSCTIYYDGNGATNPSQASASRTISYTFVKWNTEQNGTGTAYSPGGKYSANKAATLWAQWSSTTTTSSVTLPTPSRSGYNFTGWYTAKTDGTKVGNAGASYNPGNTATSVTLYAQWSAAAATLSTVTSEVVCGNNVTASWTSTGSTYKYELKVTCGNAEASWSGLTAEDASSTTVQIPTSWYSMDASLNGPLRDTTSATATCTLYTYASDGTTLIGTTSSKTFTVKVPTSVVPTVGALTAVSDSSNGVVAGWGTDVFVQGYSFVKKLQLAVSSHGDGAVLGSVVFSGPGMSTNQVTSGSSPYSSASGSVINSAGWQRYTAVYTNSRGQSVTKTLDVNFHAYAQPTVSTIAVGRSDKNGNDNNSSGAWIKFTPKFSYSSCGGHNQLSTHTAQYTLHGSSAVLGSLTCTSETTYAPINAEATPPTGTIWPVSATSAYDVSVILVDSIQANAGTNTTLTTTLPSVQGIWFGKGNDRLGLGGVPTGPGLHVDWNAEFNGVLDVTKRRCEATLSSRGWYRVCKVANIGRGDYSFALDLNICRQFYYADNEQHGIRLIANWDSYSFVNENSKSNTQIITKIRYTRDSNNNGYVDIYYDFTNANIVYCEFAAHGFYPELYTIESLQPVAPSPNGETVLPEYEYTFAANTGMRVVHAQSSTSFGDAIATIKDIIGDNNITYGGNAANNLHAGISGFSSGVVTVFSDGGPAFFVTLGKYTAAYYAAELFTYNYPWRIRIRNVNGTYHAELYYPNY